MDTPPLPPPRDILSLPLDAWTAVGSNLTSFDLLNLSSTCMSLHSSISHNGGLWRHHATTRWPSLGAIGASPAVCWHAAYKAARLQACQVCVVGAAPLAQHTGGRMSRARQAVHTLPTPH
jgi:hypothetical protein